MTHLLDDQTCTRCVVLVASRRRIVHGYGDPTSGIMFVGEAPGRHGADQTGVPFTGDKSGRRLLAMVRALGLASDDTSGMPELGCFVTNTVRCCPPNNRTPLPSETANCAPFLNHELAIVAPRIIVPIGRVALQAVGMRFLGYDPGLIRPLHATALQAKTCAIIPMVHPSRISNAQIAVFLEVFANIYALHFPDPHDTILTTKHAG